ncbi:helix-turn-helix transcriptional regulator [Atopobium sp. oral taxon 810]|uniref:helix-turn-helix domain-containing protein n=1 Tax=Atopobium sp. oral taxon 810 TaxID=712158 RepID=UPI00041C23DC|nr:helix-turn-helix transcriptional regulator [Atopobium sp. oral taxon 810]
MEKQTMGTIIASKRKAAGMTQLELADKMGVTDKAVSKWERDLSFPDVNSIPKLAEVLGVTVEELMQCKEQNLNSTSPSKVKETIGLILSAVPLAMGVAVVVLKLLGQLDVKSGFTMLGIGMTCIGIKMFQPDGDRAGTREV